MDLVDHLRLAIGADVTKRPLIVCGAGISIALSDGSAPTWKALIESGINRVGEVDGTAATNDWQKSAISHLKTASSTELIELADDLALRLGGTGDAEFRGWLAETFGQLRIVNGKLADAIRNLRCPIATTNYDDLLCEALGYRLVLWSDYEAVNDVLNGSMDGVIHLHGHWRYTSSIILGKRSYDHHGDDKRQAVNQQFISLQRPAIFIGCSMSGLTDPEFERLGEWIKASNTITQRRYWLVKNSDVVSPYFSKRIFPVSFGDDHKDLSVFLQNLRKRSSYHDGQLPADPVMIGRADQRTEGVGAILSGSPVTIITGGPGFGKTTLGLSICYDKNVIDQYGSNRLFLPLDASLTSESTLREICKILSCPTNGSETDLLNSIETLCSASKYLLVLDNFETPYEREPQRVEALLERLSSISGLTLLVTVRGYLPKVAKATMIGDVTALPVHDARVLFLRFAQTVDPADPDLDPLLNALDGHALSIVLLSAQSGGQQSLAFLRTAYELAKVQLLSVDGGDHRLTSTRASLRLSFDSPNMTAAGKRAVKIIAYCPAGLAIDDVAEILGTDPVDLSLGVLCLLNLRLIEQRGDRLYMLAPIREAAQEDIRAGIL